MKYWLCTGRSPLSGKGREGVFASSDSISSHACYYPYGENCWRGIHRVARPPKDGQKHTHGLHIRFSPQEENRPPPRSDKRRVHSVPQKVAATPRSYSRVRHLDGAEPDAGRVCSLDLD